MSDPDDGQNMSDHAREWPDPPCDRTFFINDDSDEAGIPWRNFVTALQVWSFMRPGNGQCTVREAALAFDVTDKVVRDAVSEHYWMSLYGPDDDPTKQFIEHEGE